MSQRADETFEEYRKRQQTPLPGNRSGKSGAAFDELLNASIEVEAVPIILSQVSQTQADDGGE